VTYPIWYDSSYWYQGMRIWFDPARFAKSLSRNLRGVTILILRRGFAFLLGLAAFFLFCPDKRLVPRRLAGMWPVWVPGVVGLLLYSILVIETRHLGAFVALVLLSLYVVLPVTARGVKWSPWVILVLGLLWGSRYLPSDYAAPVNIAEQVAAGLTRLGLRPNDKVASVCYSNNVNVFWARLAKAHIVAETAIQVNFWALTPPDQQRVLKTLARSGATIAVSDRPPPQPSAVHGWIRVGNTNFFADPLTKNNNDGSTRLEHIDR
jgi:hypothetical protein